MNSLARRAASLALLLAAALACGCDDDAAPADVRDTSHGDAPDPDASDASDASDPGDARDTTPAPAPPLPAWLTAEPSDGATEVPRTAWLVLTFASAPSAEALAGFALACGEGTPAFTVEPLDGGRVLVNPAAELPAGAACALTWRGPTGDESLAFSVAAAGEPAVVPYDRDDRARIAPFPDDTLLVPDATTPTGVRVQLPRLDRPGTVLALFDVLVDVVPEDLDGFSALAPIVLEVPAPLDRGSLPRDEAATLDPLAPLGLFDVDPASPRYLQRVPFDLVLKDQPDADGTAAHVLLVFPVAPLEPRGRYAFVVTRRALVDPTRPLAPSPYSVRVLADPATPSGAAAAALGEARPALHGDDLALVLRLSVRSLEHTGEELLFIRKALLAMPAPRYTITKVTAQAGPVAAILEGTWEAPDWRDDAFLARDDAGLPELRGTRTIPFTMALPRSAERGTKAPLVMYQHGSPGSAAAEVPQVAREGLAAAGFAVAGFTDILNREYLSSGDGIGAFAGALLTETLQRREVPDMLALLDTADQLAFIRCIQSMDAFDVLPVDEPDGAPDLDPGAPLAYLGISNGSFRGTGLVPFAPEIRAAALLVGGGRIASVIVAQADSGGPDDVYTIASSIFRGLSRAELWSAVAMIQTAADEQDWATHARHLYRAPYALEARARASVLMVEGLGDTLVPTSSTRAAASAMGLVQLDPLADPVPTLTRGGTGPLRANVDADTTAGFLQYVPRDLAGLEATPACASEPEGHYCAQIAARPVYVRFFESALVGTPTITP